MTNDRAGDQARNLAELRAIAQRLGLGALTPEDLAPGELAARLRAHPEGPTFLARLRRGGLSDTAIAAALLEPPTRRVPPPDA
jgi:hypothetical protein